MIAVPSDQPRRVELPEGKSISVPTWAPDERRFAFTLDEPDGIAVWVADAQAATAAAVPGLRVRDVLAGDPTSVGSTVRWSRDGRTLLALGAMTPPAEPGPEPIEPQVTEVAGKRSQMATFTDLLRTDADADVFEELATTVPLRVEPDSGAATELGPPGLYYHVSESPDGEHLLVYRLERPFSFRVPFPYSLAGSRSGPPPASWSASSLICRSATRCLVTACRPARGWSRGRNRCRRVSSGPRRRTAMIPLVKVEFRDQVYRLRAPSDELREPCIQVEHRCLGWYDMTSPGELLITEHDRDRRWLTSRLTDLAAPQDSPRDLRSFRRRGIR